MRFVFCFLLLAVSAQAGWVTLFEDDFSGLTSDWVYSGITNGGGQPLFYHDSTQGVVRAEWDQSNAFSWTSDPYIILPSSFSHPLPRMLTDHDTFRLRAVLNVATGTVADTTELFQIASIGFFGMAAMGPDRAQSDNFSGNSNMLKDGSDFVEFSYFINNAWGGPNITATTGAHIDGTAGDYTTGTNWTQTAMGEGFWLPEGTNLYVELVYCGAATNETRRKAFCTIYHNPDFSGILSVNGVAMHYDTTPLPDDKFFRADSIAMQNWPSSNWGGENGFGRGFHDDVRVEQYFSPGEFYAQQKSGGYLQTTFAAESGTVYRIEYSTDLRTGWDLAGSVTSAAEFVTFTNSMPAAVRFYRVTK
ncbi:MAG: hypothetical protein AB7T27_02410 [Kiritimatiellia bacterium]